MTVYNPDAQYIGPVARDLEYYPQARLWRVVFEAIAHRRRYPDYWKPVGMDPERDGVVI